MTPPEDGLIETAYPQYTRVESRYVKFNCPNCGITNSTNTFTFGNAEFVVCGSCYESNNLRSIRAREEK